MSDLPHSRDTSGNTYISNTLSTCPECLALVNTKVIEQHSKIYFKKFCPVHGHSTALVSEDVEHYLGLRSFSRPGSIPHRFATEVRKGCPSDCGLCPDHEQHTCHPIVEVTDKCDMHCPICIAENRQRGFMSASEFRTIIDNLVASEGTVENITLSGGEPSLHPDFDELIAAAVRPEVSRVSLVTNGNRIAADRDFCRKLRDRNVYVILQWDGFDNDVYMKLRGAPVMEAKKRALENIESFGLATQLIFVAARGVNEHQMGKTVDLMLNSDNILSLAIQPLTFSGSIVMQGSKSGESKDFSFNPMDRVTVPGAIKALAAQSGGLLEKEDFLPLPCPNPECVSLTYLLRLDDGGYMPFPRFVDMRKYLHLLSDSATIAPDHETETALLEIIGELWSTAGENPESERVTKALKRAIREIYSPESERSGAEALKVTEGQAKSIFIHHYMDRYNFELSRVRKCCHHYPRTDGRIMPICSFNLFHRQNEANPYAA